VSNWAKVVIKEKKSYKSAKNGGKNRKGKKGAGTFLIASPLI